MCVEVVFSLVYTVTMMGARPGADSIRMARGVLGGSTILRLARDELAAEAALTRP